MKICHQVFDTLNLRVSDGFKTAIQSGLSENDLVLVRTRETGPDSQRQDKSEAL